MFMFLGIPVIVTVVNNLVEKGESSNYVTKLGSRSNCWHVNVVAAISFSFFLTCIILIVSFTAGESLVGWENTWLSPSGSISKVVHNTKHFNSILFHLETYKIILALVITKFLGCLMLAFLTLFLKQLVKNGVVIVAIMLVPPVIELLGVLNFPFYTSLASLAWTNWVNPMITVYHSLALFIISLVLYGVTGLLYERKDFLS